MSRLKGTTLNIRTYKKAKPALVGDRLEARPDKPRNRKERRAVAAMNRKGKAP